jgi:hypothetical protein
MAEGRSSDQRPKLPHSPRRIGGLVPGDGGIDVHQPM